MRIIQKQKEVEE